MSLLLLAVYKSSRRDEMYLYVPKADGLGKLPPELLQVFGTPRHLMDLPLRPGRDLGEGHHGVALLVHQVAEGVEELAHHQGPVLGDAVGGDAGHGRQ